MPGTVSSPPCLLWPFTLIWQLITFAFKAAKRLIIIGAGLFLIAVGVIFCMTIIGLFVGIPLMLFGFLLLVKGVF